MAQDPLYLVLGLVGLLTVASLLLPVARRINFPFTVLLAVVGILLACLHLLLRQQAEPGLAREFLLALDQLTITSDIVFFVFLPALLFESALSIHVRHLLADIRPILLLAVIGLLLSTAIAGGAIWLAGGATLVICLLIGAIISATDPVAVVAIFKDLGAPKRLTILVEGESLFNDATAIVLFALLASLLIGTAEPGLLSGVSAFLQVFLGGVLTGLLIALAICQIIARLRHLPMVEITLTLCLAYISFVVAEHYLHVSGVMAVVTAGLVMGSRGRTQISPENWHTLTETWEMLGFWANSLIFFLVGLLIPDLLSRFDSDHILLLGLLILAALIARALVMFGLLPLMSRTGLIPGISPAFRMVMWWGGLRGAVSLALLLVLLEHPALNESEQALVAILVTGFVLFTLFIHAPSMPVLMRFLGLDRLSPTDLAIRNRAIALSLRHIRDELARLSRARSLTDESSHQVLSSYEQRLTQVETDNLGMASLGERERLLIGLTTITGKERQLHLQRFAEQLVSPGITRLLLIQNDRLQDGLKSAARDGYQQAVRESLMFERGFQLALQLHRRLGWQGPLGRRIATRFEVLQANQAAVQTLIEFSRDKAEELFGQTTAQDLLRVLSGRLAQTEQALDALVLQYPDYARTLRERHLARLAIRLEDADYKLMHEEQIIGREVYQTLMTELEQRALQLSHQPPIDLGLNRLQLVSRMPYFIGLEPQRLNEIAQLLSPRLALPGERIVARGEPGDAMYFISTGAVEVAIEPPVRMGSGDFFGEIALITTRPRTADVIALSYCNLLVLQAGDLQRLLSQHPDLKATITRTAEQRLDQLNRMQ